MTATKLPQELFAEDEKEDQEPLLRDSESQDSPRIRNSQKRLPFRCSVYLWTVVATGAFIGGLLTGLEFPWDRDMFCARRVTQGCECFDTGPSRQSLTIAAPLLEDVSISYKTIRFNGTFLNENVYRQSASPEVDAAWEALGANCEDSSSSTYLHDS